MAAERTAREARELAAKQRKVVDNRRRMREAEARGERWTIPEGTRVSRRVPMILVAAICVLFVGGLLAIPAVRRRLRWRPSAEPIPGSPSGR